MHEELAFAFIICQFKARLDKKWAALVPKIT